MENGQLFAFMSWGFGICAMGFFFLATMLWRVVGYAKDAEKEVNNELKSISNSVVRMSEALVGTIKEKGFVTKHYELEARVKDIEGMIENKRK